MDDAARKQVIAQCRVVSHLARCIASIYGDHADIFTESDKVFADLGEIIGRQSAELMEIFGDILNGMDAVTEDDEWTEPIFEEAQRRWPSAQDRSPQ